MSSFSTSLSSRTSSSSPFLSNHSSLINSDPSRRSLSFPQGINLDDLCVRSKRKLVQSSVAVGDGKFDLIWFSACPLLFLYWVCIWFAGIGIKLETLNSIYRLWFLYYSPTLLDAITIGFRRSYHQVKLAWVKRRTFIDSVTRSRRQACDRV